MPSVADALRRHGPAYLEKFGERMPAEQRRVLQAMMACGTGQLGELAGQAPAEAWRRPWVVDCQAVGDGSSAVKYLAPYVFRSAISDRRIAACDERQVTFTYRRSGSRRTRRMTLEGEEFVRRLLQHVLPRGLQKVRHYGLLSPNSRVPLDLLRWLVAAALGAVLLLACGPVTTPAASPAAVRCAARGGPLLLLAVLPPADPQPPAPRSRPP